MDDDQQFCLRWNNHQSTLIQNFDTLLERGTLVDCTLAAEGKYLMAHKVVLSACSPYFEGLLSEHYDKHPVFILKDVKFKELEAMMNYMYRGEVNISQDQLTALLKAAESLQIKGLSDSKTGGSSTTTTGKSESTRSAKTASSTTSGVSSGSVDIPHTSSGLSMEKINKVPRQSLQQVSVSDLPDDSASPQLRGISSREGSQSPSRKRKRIRRRSVNDDTSQSMENHEASNSSDVLSAPSMGAATIAEDKTHADPAEPISRSALMQQLTKQPADEMLQIPLEKPEPSEEMIQPKSEYVDDQESVEDLTHLDDDMNDLNEMEDNSRAGPSHDPSQHSGIAPWHISGDRSSGSVVTGAAPGAQDDAFLVAHEAAQAQRDSQGNVFPSMREFVTSKQEFDISYTIRLPDPIRRRIQPDYIQYRLYYCTNCNKTLQYNRKKGNACNKCKTIFKFKCGRCFKLYKSLKSLGNHLRIECNQQPKNFCKECNYKAYQKANLDKHIQKVHLIQNPVTNKCNFCGVSFSNQTLLQRHLREVCGQHQYELH